MDKITQFVSDKLASNIGLGERKALYDLFPAQYEAIVKDSLNTISKSFDSGLISQDTFSKALMNLGHLIPKKVQSDDFIDHEQLLTNANVFKAMQHIYNSPELAKALADMFGGQENDIEKSHKYISKKPDDKGGWVYEYPNLENGTKSILNSDTDLHGRKKINIERETGVSLSAYAKPKSINDIEDVEYSNEVSQIVANKIAKLFNTGVQVAGTGSSYFGINLQDQESRLKTLTIRISDHGTQHSSKADFDLSFKPSDKILNKIKEFISHNKLELFDEQKAAIKNGLKEIYIRENGTLVKKTVYQDLIDEGVISKEDVNTIISSAGLNEGHIQKSTAELFLRDEISSDDFAKLLENNNNG